MGSVSGGNFNPAVTVAIFLSGEEKDIMKTVLYICVQLAGGIAAGCVYCSVFGSFVPL